MRKWYPVLLIAALALLPACGSKQAAPPADQGPSLADVRKQAELAVDGNLPSKERSQARDQAISMLLSFLRSPESTRVSTAEWEQPFPKGSSVQLHHFEDGKVRAIGLTLPGSGIVPPGERVVVQYANGGVPQASEVEVLPGGQLVGARMLDDKSVMLAFGLARGGGYIGYYQRDTRTGEFKPDPTVFKGLPASVGDVRLDPRGNFLAFDVPVDTDWRPAFDKTHPQRFYINADVGLEWKNKFVVVDERNFTAFQGFVTAANTSARKEDRLDAWEKATRKLPAYLQQVESLTDQVLAKLPTGARELVEGTGSLTVRVISIPAPEGLGMQGFTVIQHRVGSGMPMATVPNLPGLVDSFKVIDVGGLPGLELLSVPALGKGRVVTLLRTTDANDWAPASDWFGSLPAAEPGLRMQRGPGAADLTIEADDPRATVTLQADKSVQVCAQPSGCFALTWLGGHLSGGARVLAGVKQIVSAGQLPASQVLQVANSVSQFLQSPDSAGLTAAQMAAMAGAGAKGWDVGADTRVLAFPPNGSGVMPVVIQAGKTVLVESYTPQTVTSWVDAREVTAGGNRYLLVLGRSAGSASLLLYLRSADGWQPANALEEPVNLTLAPSLRMTYTPGQADPIRGLYVNGSTDLKAYFTPDGNGVAFCAGSSPCAVYQFTTHWVLK